MVSVYDLKFRFEAELDEVVCKCGKSNVLYDWRCGLRDGILEHGGVFFTIDLMRAFDNAKGTSTPSSFDSFVSQRNADYERQPVGHDGIEADKMRFLDKSTFIDLYDWWDLVCRCIQF